MTRKEKIIATAYTGIMFINGSELGELYKYEEEKIGHTVIDIMHADESFVKKLKDAVKSDFIEMLEGKYTWNTWVHPTYSDCIEETRRKMMKEVTKWLEDNASRYIHVYWNEKEWIFEKGDLNADLKKSMGL